MTEPIFHLAEPDDWVARTDIYEAASLALEGFIHCSTRGQLDDVARRHFDERYDLILLTIDPSTVDPELVVFEDLYGLGEDYPHIYGPLPVSAVIAAEPYRNDH